MTALVNTQTVAAGSISGLISRSVAAFVAWNDVRATRKALAKLSDRELDDIGLCRGDIDAIAARD